MAQHPELRTARCAVTPSLTAEPAAQHAVLRTAVKQKTETKNGKENHAWPKQLRLPMGAEPSASRPSIEDIVMGAIPDLPKVHMYNRVLDYSLGGAEYMNVWHDAAEDK